MGVNLVICSDGTGNTFSRRATNVSALVRALDLSAAAHQVVVYDQGLGTNPQLVRAVQEFKREGGAARLGLGIADHPRHWLPRPLALPLGLAAGYGLRENVAQLYRALARHHTGADTRLFLFGFSRGAFTVRVLAGLLHRCGLAPRHVANDDARFAACFAAAWHAYRPHAIDDARVAAVRRSFGLRDTEVHFLGLWDTVKSYGGFRPVSLPHLRHNPSVQRVCHALALDEHRSWFLPTTWSGVGTDTNIQTPVPPDPRYASQQVQEVWFRGYHTDIGGGGPTGDGHEADAPDTGGRIALRWMLGEATDHDDGLRLRADAPAWLFAPEPDGPPEVHESSNAWWRASDLLPRWELENTRRPPRYPWRWRGRGARDLTHATRDGVLTVHASAGMAAGPGTRIVATKTPRRLRAR